VAFPFAVAFWALAIVFKPPNGKLFGCHTLYKMKTFVGVAHTHNL
jgi:hypothetical protein